MNTDKVITFSGLEEVIRTAIRLSCFSTSEIANKVNMSNSGLYCFTSKQNHISIEKGDAIIEFLIKNNPQSLNVALDLYFRN